MKKERYFSFKGGVSIRVRQLKPVLKSEELTGFSIALVNFDRNNGERDGVQHG